MIGPRVLLVTDRLAVPGGDLAGAVDRALAGLPAGAAWVQLREKDLGGGALVALARRLAGVCRDRGAPLIVNDRLDVARAAGAAGVHLPREGFTVAEARAAWPEALIGVSCRTAREVAEAAAQGAAYAVLGPIYDTPSKAALGITPRGPDAISEARARIGAAFPLVAIGGIQPETVGRVLAAGATGVGVIRAVFADLDPEGAARALWTGFTGEIPESPAP